MSEDGLTRTALYELHLDADAKMVEFHGFELPIWYSSIQEEHLATRAGAGMFDVSHMGFFRFSGDSVLSWLSSIATQEFLNFGSGRCGYTHFLDHEGNIIDDMIFAVKSESEVLGVPNASMVEVMLDWFYSLLPGDGSVTIEDMSGETSILAVQGPASAAVISEVLGDANSVGRFRCQEIVGNQIGVSGWIQGTGYTGEPGVEIFVSNGDAPRLWAELLEVGADSGLVPVGLGARDTLRLEKGYLLSGQDFLWPGLGIDPEISLPNGFLSRDTAETAVPYGLDYEHEFVGRERVMRSLESGARWYGLECLERGPSPRPGHAVLSSSDEGASVLGYVTSGGPSPSLGRTGIAMAYLQPASLGQQVWIQSSPRKRVRARIRRPPFV